MGWQNFYATRLFTEIGASDTTITLETAPSETAGTLVLEARNSTKREIITYTGVTGNDITGVTRGAEGTSASSHLKNSLVEMNLTAGDLQAALAAAVSLNPDGTLKDDAVSTDAVEDEAITGEKLGAPVAFRVRLSANQSVPSNTAKTVEFDTEDFDLGSNFDTTTWRFDAPYDGVYLFGMIGRAQNLGVNDVQYNYITKNGSVQTASQTHATATGEENKVGVTIPIELAAGDWVSFLTYHDYGAGNRDFEGGSGTGSAYAWGYLIGRT